MPRSSIPRDPLTYLAIVILVLGVAVPQRWLIGDPSVLATPARDLLALGAALWRASALVLGAFLLALRHWLPRRSAREAVVPKDPVPRAGLWLLGLTVVAAAVRIPGLDSSLWYDEVWTLVESVRRPLDLAWRTYPSRNHHPLFTLLAGGSVRALGESAWTLRLVAWGCGVASVPALYYFARRVCGERVALLASALLALSYHHVWFSQNARGYTALLLFVLLSSHGFLESLRTRARGAVLLQGFALGLAAYTHLSAVFLGAAQALVWIALGRRKLTPLLGLVLSGVTTCFLYGPMLPHVFHHYVLREGSLAAAKSEWSNPLRSLLETAASFGLGVGAGGAIVAVAAAIATVGFCRVWRDRPAAALLCVASVAVVGVVQWLLTRILLPRFFFGCAGFALVIAASGLWALLSRTPPLVARSGLALALVASALLLPRAWSLPKQDYPRARAFVESEMAPGEVAISVGLAIFPYEAYFGGEFVPVRSVEELDRAVRGKTRAFVVTTIPTYLSSHYPELAAALERRGREVRRFPGTVGGGDVSVLLLEVEEEL